MEREGSGIAPQEGKFIAEDPLRLFGDTNLYNYVDGDPLNAFDPRGLCKIIVKFTKVIKGLPVPKGLSVEVVGDLSKL